MRREFVCLTSIYSRKLPKNAKVIQFRVRLWHFCSGISEVCFDSFIEFYKVFTIVEICVWHFQKNSGNNGGKWAEENRTQKIWILQNLTKAAESKLIYRMKYSSNSAMRDLPDQMWHDYGMWSDFGTKNWLENWHVTNRTFLDTRTKMRTMMNPDTLMQFNFVPKR